MSREVQGLLVQIEATTAQLRREMASADQVVTRTSRQIDRQLNQVDTAFDRTAKRAQQAGNMLRSAFAVAAGAGMIGNIIKQADAYGEMAERVRDATTSTAEYQAVQARLRATADGTYRSLAEAQETYIQSSRGLKQLGYSTNETLDIVDSLSYAFVRNATSSDKARSAMTALVRATNRGSVLTDHWASLLVAVPTLLDNIADATGMTAEEVSKLGYAGQLSAQMLTEGLRKSLEENKAAADEMATTVGDALTKINTAMQVYFGELNQSTGYTNKLAAALVAIGENIDTVAAVMGGAGAGALTLYAAKATVATKASWDGYRARVAQTQATKQAATTELEFLRTTQRSLVAQLQSAQAGAQQSAIRKQLAANTQALTAAQSRLTASSAGILGVLGGPAGLALTVGAVAAGYLLFSGNADTATESMIDHNLAVDESIEKLKELNAEQRTLQLSNWTLLHAEELEKAEDALDNYVTVGMARLQNLGASGLEMGRTFGSMIDEVRSGQRSLDSVTQWYEEASGASADYVRLLKQAAVAHVDGAKMAAHYAELLGLADTSTRELTESTGELANVLSEAATKFIDANTKRIDALWAGNDPVKQAVLHIKEHGKYTKEESDAILASAGALKAATDAQARANAATQAGKDAIKAHTAAIDALISKYDPATKAQAEYEKAVAVADKALARNGITTKQYQQILKGLATDLNKPIWDKHNKAVAEAEALYKQLDDQVSAIRDRLDPLQAATRKLAQEKELLARAVDEGAMSLQEYELRLRQLDEEYAKNTRATTQWTEWTESALERVDSAFADAWRNIGDGFSSFRDSLTNAFKQMLAELAHMAITRPIVLQIGAAMGIGGAAGQATSVLGGGANVLGFLTKGVSLGNTGFGQAVAQGWQSGEGILGGLQGAFGGGSGYLSGLLGGGASVGTGSTAAGYTSQSFSNWVAQQNMAAQTWGGAATSMGAILGGLGGAYMGWQNNGLEGAVGTGLSSWGGGTLGGMGGAALGQMVGGTLGSVLPGIGTAIGVALGGLLGGSLFGGSGERFKRTVGSATGYYGDDGYVSTGVDPSFYGSSRQFGEEFDSTLDSINERFVTAMGGLFEAFDVDSSISTTLQTRQRRTSGRLAADFITEIDGQITQHLRQYGKDGNTAEAMAEFADDIMGEYLAKTIVGSSLPEYFRQQFEPLAADSKVTAEQVAETLTGIFTRFDGVNSVLELTRLAAFELTDAGMRASDAIIALSGGLDALQASTSVYYDQFFSAAEKQADTVAAVEKAFAAADITLADSRESYRAMVEDIDVTTEAGQQMFAAMMGLAGQAAQYFDILDARAAQSVAMLAAGLDASFGALQRSIAAQQKRVQDAHAARIGSLNDMAATASSSISALTSISNSLDAAVKRLRGTSDDATRSLRAQAVMTLNSALVSARSGQSLAGFDGLQDALDVASQMDTALYSSLVDFEREQGRTANLIAELGKVGGKQLSAEERLLQLVQGQISAAERQFESEMAGLAMQLAYAQSQVDALNGIDNSIMGVAAAVAAMNASVVAALKGLPRGSAQANTPVNNSSIVDTAYRTVLGREADAPGRQYWSERLQSGSLEYDQFAETLARAALQNPTDVENSKTSALKYLQGLGVPGFASGGVFGGGLRIVGEQGPELEVTGPSRIYSAGQTVAMMQGGGETAAEVRALRAEVAGLRSVLVATAKHTESTAYGVRQMNEIGLPQGESA